MIGPRVVSFVSALRQVLRFFFVIFRSLSVARLEQCAIAGASLIHCFFPTYTYGQIIAMVGLVVDAVVVVVARACYS